MNADPLSGPSGAIAGRQDEEALSLLLLLRSNAAPGSDPSCAAASASDSDVEAGVSGAAAEGRDSGVEDAQLQAEGKQLAMLKNLTMERLRR